MTAGGYVPERGAARAGQQGAGMNGVVGLAIVFAMVFGGYLLAGGKLGIILYALPFEMMMIGGAAAGGLIIANSPSGVKHTLRDIAKIFRGPRWNPPTTATCCA
jgi:chemotaxis protein MotA